MYSLQGASQVVSGKEPACQCRRQREVHLVPGSRRSSAGGHGKPTPVFLPGESHGQRNLVGYSPQDHKELDMTKVT